MNKKIFNKSGIAIDFGATKISVSQIIKGKFKKTIIIISHNKKNLEICDKIFELHNKNLKHLK